MAAITVTARTGEEGASRWKSEDCDGDGFAAVAVEEFDHASHGGVLAETLTELAEHKDHGNQRPGRRRQCQRETRDGHADGDDDGVGAHGGSVDEAAQ